MILVGVDSFTFEFEATAVHTLETVNGTSSKDNSTGETIISVANNCCTTGTIN